MVLWYLRRIVVKRKKVVILGSTGSIGMNTLNVLEEMQQQYEIYGLAAQTNWQRLAAQAQVYRPTLLALTDEKAAYALQDSALFSGEVLQGEQALTDICEQADLVVLSVVGIAGLRPFVYCLEHGIPVALATKEAMVYGGQLARNLMDATATPVLPLDSEISAIFQCLQGNHKAQVDEILLTASGGPFRTWPIDKIKNATLAQALRHPNWSMGEKITIDSASMANKGLEIIETRWMFDFDPKKITVVVHPESIVHSAVRYADGCVMAQLGATDMKLPIAYALQYPNRKPNCGKELDLFQVGTLHFERPDYEKFPCLALARDAAVQGSAMQMVFNAANDAAVEMFRAEAIGFWQISEIIAQALESFSATKLNSFEDIYAADKQIRTFVQQIVKKFI